jgi:hypothetical protein
VREEGQEIPEETQGSHRAGGCGIRCIHARYVNVVGVGVWRVGPGGCLLCVWMCGSVCVRM